MRVGKVQIHNKKKRGQRGFSLITVISISVVMLLMATTLFLKVGAQRANNVAQRGATDSFYAADAGINALAGRLSVSSFGTATIPSTSLPFVTTSNLNLSQADVTTAVLNGTISLGTTYQGATPQDDGDGLGSLVYSFRAVSCQAGTSNAPNAPCPVDESSVVTAFNAATPLPSNLARVDVMSLGFRGRSVASNIAVSIFPNPTSFFAINKYVGFGDSGITVGNGDTYSAMPFCNADALGVVSCQQVTYITAVLRNKLTGLITYVTDPTTSLNLCAIPTATSCNEKVTGIYKNGTGAFFATASNSTIPTGATPWSPVLVDSSNHVVMDAYGNPQPQRLPSSTLGTLSSYAPSLPDGAVINNSGTFTVDSTYSYLPQGTEGNLGSNGSGGGTAISTSSGSNINGALAAACGTSCISVGGTTTGGTQTIPHLDLPPAPSAPTYSTSACSNNSPTSSCMLSVTGTGSNSTQTVTCTDVDIPVTDCKKNDVGTSITITVTTQAIIPQPISGSTATGADKYPVIDLVGSNGSGGVSLSGQKNLTLYPGRYIVSDLDISGNSTLKVVQTNGDPVVLYVINSTNVGQVETLSISGNGIANTSTAAGLQIYSNTNDEIKLNGNGALRAAIYAPNSSLTLNGGGNSGELVGTYIGKTINFNGNNSRMVYDESLAREGFPIVTSGNVIMRNWRRL